MDIKSLLNHYNRICKTRQPKALQGSSSLNGLTQDKGKLGALGEAIGGGLLGALMGSKKTKKIGKKAVGIGGAAHSALYFIRCITITKLNKAHPTHSTSHL